MNINTKQLTIFGISAVVIAILIAGVIWFYRMPSQEPPLAGGGPNTPVTVSIEVINQSTSELGGDAATVKLSRKGGALSKPLTIDLRVQGSARLGTDYSLTASAGDVSTIAGGAYTFPEGISEVTFAVTPTNDMLLEPVVESVDFNLTWDGIAKVVTIGIEDASANEMKQIAFQDINIQCLSMGGNREFVVRTQAEYQHLIDTSLVLHPSPLLGCPEYKFPTIDFSQKTILGKSVTGAGCTATVEKAVLRDDKSREIVYSITTNFVGMCEMAIFANNFILVPKLPEDYKVKFEVNTQSDL